MHTLDIRWPLGLIFTVVGAILLCYAAVAGTAAGDGALLNAGWGAVLVSFGVMMLGMARGASRGGARHG